MTPDHNEAVELALLRADVEMLKVAIDKQSRQIEERIDKQSGQIAELLSAWNAASTLVSFIKLLGGIAIAIGAVIAFVKGYSK